MVVRSLQNGVSPGQSNSLSFHGLPQGILIEKVGGDGCSQNRKLECFFPTYMVMFLEQSFPSHKKLLFQLGSNSKLVCNFFCSREHG